MLAHRHFLLPLALVAAHLSAPLAHAQIAFVASSTSTMQSVTPSPPHFQAAGTAVGSNAAVSPTWPAHEQDDIGLLFCESAGGQAVSLTTANGFAAVTNSPQATGPGGSGTRITVFWARATSSAMAAPTVADPGDHVYCQILTYRGVRTTGNPWDVTGGGVKGAASGTVTVTGVTTTVANTLIVQVVSRDDDAAGAEFSAQTNANLAGIAERSDAGTTRGNGGGFSVWDGVMAAAGATGNTTATISVNTVNGFLTLALAPAAPAPRFQAAGTAASGNGAVSPAWPAHQAGDVALLFCESTGGQAVTLSTANGFAAVTGSPQSTGAGGAGTRLTVFWARATSGAMAAPTVADPGDHVACQILTYRGVVETGDPWDVTGGGTKGTASTSIIVTGVTTTVDNTLIVQASSRDPDSAAAAFSAQANANLAGITERTDTGTTSGNGGGFAVWDGVMASAGATGNTDVTVTNSVNAFLTIALLPAGNRLGVPTGTVAGDVMVASIAVRPSTTNILPPSGWTALAATVQNSANSSRQQIFYKVASAADEAGAFYVWRFDDAHTGAVGGIVSYTNVDTVSASPIDVSGGNTTVSATSHQANEVATTVPNTMVISTHSFTSSETWTAAGGMTPRVNISSETPSNTAGISLLMAEVAQSAAGATGNKTATVGANADAGTAQVLALRPAYTHYAISAVSTTVANCDYAEITISGHTASHALAAPAGTRTVTLGVSAGGGTAGWQATLVSGTGTWTPAGATATYLWPGSEASFTVRLRQSAVTSLNVTATDNGGITKGSGAEDPALDFVNSAFRISDGANAASSIGTQISGKPSNTGFGSQTLFLQAVRTDTTTGACTTIFAQNTDVDIEVGAQCINPASCARNVTLTTSALSSSSGSFTPAGAASFPATIKFRFTTASAEAPFSFSYADAGQIRLQFRHVTASPAVTVSGNSNNFVVRPFGLAFPGVQHGNTASAGLLAAAGDNFSLTLTGYQWASGEDANDDGNPDSGANITDNGDVPNFAATAIITPTANLPGVQLGTVSRGATCASGGTIALSGGTATAADWCYSEAGNVLLKADVTDYITSGVNVTGDSSNDGGGGASGYVGRFRPKYFAITGTSTLTNRAAQLPVCSPASGFTYMSENLDLGFTLEAQNTQGVRTQNYTGAYAKLAPGSANFNLGARDGATNFSTASRVDTVTSSGTWSNGQAAVTLRSGILRAASPDGPYTAVSFGIAPNDGEGVVMSSFDLNIGGSNDRKNLGVTGNLRFGRLRLQNALASSGTLVLPLPMELQYWNGSAFITNADDSCTTLPTTIVGLASSLVGGSTSVSSSTFTAGTGRGFVRLAAPGPAASGFVLVTPNLTTTNQPVAGTPARTYLQGNWGGSATWNVNPSARASWGLFGGQPQNFIFQRENY